MAKRRAAAKADTPPDLKALTPEQLATLLSRAGQGAVTAADIAADVAAGAPTNRDGSLHFVRYAAWLASQVP